MSAWSDVIAQYRAALHRGPAVITTHHLVRLLVSAVCIPLAAMILAAVVGLSDQSALTDQDIAWFVLTPAGFLGALVVLSLAIMVSVLDVALMTRVMDAPDHSMMAALRGALAFLPSRLPRLLWFSAALVLRMSLIALPFCIAMGGVAFLLLRDHDINYYLTYRPPAYVLAAALIGLLGVGLAVTTLLRLTGWSVALPIVLGGERPSVAFASSRRMLLGRRRPLLFRFLVWGLVRLVLVTVLLLPFGALMSALPDLFGARLGMVAAMVAGLIVLGMWANAAITAVSHAALAGLLSAQAGMSGVDEVSGPRTWRVPPWIVVAGAGACAVAGLWYGSSLLAQAETDRTVEIIAHRGAAGLRPENTMAAVLKAIEDGADWIEVDVQETADDVVVVAHDSDFMKLAGVELKVWNATMADIERIDIGSWYGPDYADQRTPTLRDVLLAARGQARVIIELKYYGHDEDLEARVARVVEETGMAGQVAVMSLWQPGVARMRALRPEWRTGILAARAIGDLSGLDTDFLAVNTGQVSLGLIKKAHGAGKQVYVWTVDDPVTMSRMMSTGVDGLITNQPALAREVMEARNTLDAPERLLLWLADRFDIGSFQLVADERDA